MCLEGRIQRRKISGGICRQDCTDKGALVRSLDKWPGRCSASQLDRRAEVRRRDGTRDGDRRHGETRQCFPGQVARLGVIPGTAWPRLDGFALRDNR